MEHRRPTLTMDAPAVYAIHVQGTVDLDWADRLNGMQVVVSHASEGTHTQLIGRLPDQAALLGVVNSLFNSGFPILKVSLLSGH
jgi:hypothetical protein